MPLFTIVIPSFNRASVIRATLDSLVAQTERDYEALIVDGGSSDNTEEIVRSYPEPIRFLARPGTGVGEARNIAMREAKGEYCVFLDSDDIWFPWTLACFRRAIESRQGHRPGLITGHIQSFWQEDELKDVHERAFKLKWWKDLFEAVDEVPLLPTMATAARTDLALAVGGFLEQRLNAEDVDLWIRLGTAHGFVQIQQPVLAGYRQTPGGLSCDMGRLHKGNMFMITRELEGIYPGGPERAKARRVFISGHVRAAATECITRGDIKSGLSLYFNCLKWNTWTSQQIKWTLGMPVWALTRGLPARLRSKKAARGASA